MPIKKRSLYPIYENFLIQVSKLEKEFNAKIKKIRSEKDSKKIEQLKKKINKI